jgi:hypothetical protein
MTMEKEQTRYIKERLASATIVSEPFLHLYVEQIFPPDLYAEMLASCRRMTMRCAVRRTLRATIRASSLYSAVMKAAATGSTI